MQAVRRGAGDGRARTADPLLAKQVLSQLSYIPVFSAMVDRARRLEGPVRGPFWIRTRDLTVISRALSPTELKAPAGRTPTRCVGAAPANVRTVAGVRGRVGGVPQDGDDRPRESRVP